MKNLSLGNKVPDISLPRTSGEPFSLESYREAHKGWTLVIFFRGSWCPVCMEDLKELQEHLDYFKGKEVHLLTVSTDDLDSLTKMVDEHEFTFPVVADENREALEDFGVFYHSNDDPYEDHGAHGEPAYFLIDEHGKLLYQQKQTSPFGRPTATELRKIVQYIRKNLKK